MYSEKSMALCDETEKQDSISESKTEDMDRAELDASSASESSASSTDELSTSSTDELSSSSTGDISDSDMEGDDKVKRGLQDGYVTIFSTKVSITGPPGSGKSNFCALILNKSKPHHRNSTPIAKNAVQATQLDFKRFKEGLLVLDKSDIFGQWMVIDNEKLTNLVATTATHPELRYDHDNTLFECTETPDPDNQQMPTSKVFNWSKTAKKVRKLLRSNKRSQLRKGLNKIHLIYLVDTGGQAQFQEVLPLFVRNSSVNMFVFKLSEGLGDKPNFEYVVKGNHYAEPEEMKLTNEQIILHSARSVYSSTQAKMINRAVSTPERPALILVGMFKDEVDKCNETLQRKQETLMGILEPFVQDDKLHRCNLVTKTRREPIFDIDGSSSGWNSNGDNLRKIRHSIDQMSERLHVEVPLRWFIFFIDLRERASSNLARKFITLEECYQLARKSSGGATSDKDVDDALRYFDELNLILYYPNILKEIVFYDPNFLLMKVSELIVASFQCTDASGIDDMMHERENFQRQGIFTLELLKYSISNDGFDQQYGFAQEQFLKLLEKLLVVAKTGKDMYFMPCVLSFDPLESGHKPQLKESMAALNIDPLIISFASDFCPRGVFCATIVHLTRDKRFVLQPSKRLACQRNLIEFAVRLTDDEISEAATIGTVAIAESESLSFYEVYSTCENYCVEIRRAVMNAIYEAVQTLSYNLTHLEIECGFLCTNSSCKDERPHGSVVFKDSKQQKRYIHCRKAYRRGRQELTSKQGVWYSDNVNDLGV